MIVSVKPQILRRMRKFCPDGEWSRHGDTLLLASSYRHISTNVRQFDAPIGYDIESALRLRAATFPLLLPESPFPFSYGQKLADIYESFGLVSEMLIARADIPVTFSEKSIEIGNLKFDFSFLPPPPSLPFLSTIDPMIFQRTFKCRELRTLLTASCVLSYNYSMLWFAFSFLAITVTLGVDLPR